MVGIISCNNTMKSKPIVTVSIQPQKYLLEKIVGDKYDVSCMLAQGANPEAYEPSMSHLMNLEKSLAFFKIGNIGFELAIMDKVKSNNPDLKIFDTSKGINLISGTHKEDIDDGHHHEIDPHVWSSVTNAKIIAKNMYEAMVEIDPKHKNYFTKNYRNLQNELNQLNDSVSNMLDSMKGKSFLIWHPSLSYFARDYGLNQISLGSEGKDISIKNMKAKIQQAKADSSVVFFFQPEFDGRQAQTIDKELGIKTVSINPMNYNWKQEILKTANAIAGKK